MATRFAGQARGQAPAEAGSIVTRYNISFPSSIAFSIDGQLFP
jgi:hypothetical protein